MISALFLRKHRPAGRDTPMNSTALTITQRAWINALATAVVLIAIVLLGVLG
jgi:hypothetical protein